jgi:hypothetical protein
MRANAMVWIAIAVGLVLAAPAGSLAADLYLNASLADADQDNCPDGWVCHGNVYTGRVPVGGEFVDLVYLSEPAAGGLSRMRQDFEAFVGFSRVSLRFALAQSPGSGSDLMPPDAFCIFVLDGSGQSLAPPLPELVLPAGMAQAAYYLDTDGRQAFDASAVTVSTPDADGLRTATIDFPATLDPNAPVRIEIGLASAKNNANSLVVLEHAQVSSSSGCGQGDPRDTGVIIMFDSTNSVCKAGPYYWNDMVETMIRDGFINALKGGGSPVGAEVSVALKTFGRLHTPYIEQQVAFTKDVTTLTNTLTSMHRDNIRVCNDTSLDFVINHCAQVFADEDEFSRKHIVIFTDGWVNAVSTGSSPPDIMRVCDTTAGGCGDPNTNTQCVCDAAQSAAAAAASAARQQGIMIHVVHYVSCTGAGNCGTGGSQFPGCLRPAGSGTDCDAFVIAAGNWLAGEIAFCPEALIDVSDRGWWDGAQAPAGGIQGEMARLAQRILCEDGDPDTVDSCEASGCVSQECAP